MFNGFAFFSYIFLTAITPGPNNIMAMTCGSKYGFKKGLKFCFGVFIGFLIIISLCTFLGTILFNLMPKIAPFIKYAGAVYILYLAYKTLKDKPKEESDNLIDEKKLILNGMLLQFINPKLIIYGITSMSTFILPHFKTFNILSFFILALSLMGLLCTILWNTFGVGFNVLFKKHYKILNIILSILLIYCVISLIL